MQTGDRILEVSGIDLRQASHEIAVQAIRNASNPVTFIVQSLIPWVCILILKNIIHEYMDFFFVMKTISFG